MLAAQTVQAFELPRNSEELYAARDMALQKLAMKAPEYVDQVADAFTEGIDAVKQVGPILSNQLIPEAFAQDPYQRFDGRIHNPAMREKARNDVLKAIKRGELDAPRGNEVIMRLNEENIFEGIPEPEQDQREQILNQIKPRRKERPKVEQVQQRQIEMEPMSIYGE
jgi:hypothetical protein